MSMPITMLVLGALTIAALPAHAQFAQDNVTSDSNSNTAMGGAALAYVQTSTGYGNTAAGVGVLFSLTTGNANTAFGTTALQSDISGNNNTAVGWGVLFSNVLGSDNTALGAHALVSSPGSQNTAVGSGAMWQETPTQALGNGNVAVGFLAGYEVGGVSQDTAIGNQALTRDTAGYNTAVGTYAMNSNTSGQFNTAVGADALLQNATGGYNTAVGSGALSTNTASFNSGFGTNALIVNSTGGANTALGNSSLEANTTGSNNTASGSNALYANQIGNNNTADGDNALEYTTGSNSTAVGANALAAATTGSGNIGLGYQAGMNLTTGSSNIEIGNEGASVDSKVIRIGTEGIQKKAFVAGIYGNTAVSGLAVVIGSNGELGTVSSSERFKTAIASMGANTEKLGQLRPVTFRYKADQQGTLRYGLIAEEVAKVYPELVVRDNRGRIDGVRYDELAPMLLNEMQKEQATIAAQNRKIASLEQHLADIQAALSKLQPKDELVAQR